jgi:hypothetical protein
MKRLFTVCAALSLSYVSAVRAQDMPAEYQQVLTTLGKQGDDKANVLNVNFPRHDPSVTVANVKTPTPGPAEKLALGFKATLDQFRTPKSTAATD